MSYLAAVVNEMQLTVAKSGMSADFIRKVESQKQELERGGI